MSKKFRFLSCLTAVFALALMAVSPVAFAHHKEGHEQGSASSEDTKGNDRKSGYEDNSSTPQETNHGKGADNDGDAGNEPRAYTEDDDNDGRNNAGQTAGGNESYPNASRHPSGKDKYIEPGGSGNQGKSESNPDDSKGPMRYEGVQGDDKPNGPGGEDIYDQDGNNGCGNDQDFDDDNNGWCGKPDRTKAADVSKPTCPDGKVMPSSAKCEQIKGQPEVADVVIERCPDGSAMPASGDVKDCEVEVGTNPGLPEDDVLGERIERDLQPAQAAQPAQPAPSVLGIRLSPALNEPVEVAGAVLPFTGGDALIFLAAAMALIGAGVVAVRFRSNES